MEFVDGLAGWDRYPSLLWLYRIYARLGFFLD